MSTVVGLSVVGQATCRGRQTFHSTFALTVLLLLGVGCANKPPVRISISGNTARVDVHTDGEYGTQIAHLRLRNARTHTTVWDLKANSRKPVLGTFVLKEGDNPAPLYSPAGTYEVIVPAGSNVFRLDRGVEYELSLWKEPDSTPARVTFHFTN